MNSVFNFIFYLDQIAFPDFQAGAMEHWGKQKTFQLCNYLNKLNCFNKKNLGFVGYKETNLLYSETKNTLADKQAVAMVIAHEIAHFVSMVN